MAGELAYGTVSASTMEEYNRITNNGRQLVDVPGVTSTPGSAVAQSVIAVLGFLGNLALSYRIEMEVKALGLHKQLKANELDGICYEPSALQIGILVAVILAQYRVGELTQRSFVSCFQAAAGLNMIDAYRRFKKEGTKGMMVPGVNSPIQQAVWVWIWVTKS